MNKAARKVKNQAMAARLKADGVERTQGRCCICFVIYNADFLDRGFAGHRCKEVDKDRRGAKR